MLSSRAIRNGRIMLGRIACGALELVDRALDPQGASLENVGVDHGRADVLVAEERLDGSDVGSILEQMRCEGVTEGVRGDALGQMGPGGGAANGALGACFREMMSANDPRAGIARELRGWEDPVPAPLQARVGVLARERVGECDSGLTSLAIALEELSNTCQVPRNGLFERARKEGRTIAVSLSFPHGELAAGGVEVLDS